ncbi:MAG: hypothetical protein HY271_11600 [Deltaproteobacteria bacterium]|nr:hypothetical protein [Deltaproteobacteria bacterium]
MRKILVGVMVAMMAMAGPAMAGPGGMGGGCDPAAPHAGGAVHFTNPTGGMVYEHGHGAGAEFGLAFASTGLSLLYLPVRFVYGVVGAGLGGFGGWATGGDLRTAKGLWRPTTEGHYFIRPDYLDGSERFRFNGAVSPVRETQVAEAPLVTTHESHESVVNEAAPLEPAPADVDDDTL